MLNLLKEYIERVINEEIKNIQYPKGYYSDGQHRIPFREYGYGHSYIDHYIDWIKAISKKGTLPKPSVNFKEEVYKGIEKFHDNKHANRCKRSREYMPKKELQDYMENVSTLFKDAKFKNGNLYVERQIGVKIDDIHQESSSLFNGLVQRYNNTIGGCWAFREGKGSAYCSDFGANFFITFKGYMFLDDIYWDELIRLETRPNMREYEVRSYPNGRVQLEEIDLYDEENNTKVTLTTKDFDGPRIINSTFLGNKGTFNGNFAKLGYENIGYENKFIDREGNLYKNVAPIVLKELESGKKIEDIVDENETAELENGLRLVCYYNQYNFINKQGNLVFPNQWFDGVGEFDRDGFAKVKLNKKYNWIDIQGNLLSPNLWFDEYWDFINGFARVKLNKKYNWIDIQGNLLSPNLWFDGYGGFNEGFAEVELDNKWNFIDTQGNLLSPNQWFDNVGNFNDGFAVVELNDEQNFIDKEGNLLSPNRWFDECKHFENGFARVKLNDKWNLIDGQGKVISPNQWFDDCYNFENGFVRAKLNGKWNFINKQGNILSPNQWFDDCWDFERDGLARVAKNDKWNWIDTQANILFPNQWFDGVGDFDRDGFAPIKLNGKWNFINKQGNILSPNQWFDGCYYFKNGFAQVNLNKKWYLIDRDVNFYDRDTKQPIPNPTQKNESFRRNKQTLMEARFRNYLNRLVKEMMII